MHRLPLPPLDWPKIAAWLADHARPITTHAAQVFGGGASTAFLSPYGEALLRLFEPAVSRCIGARVYGSYSFGWVYPNGSFLGPHLDRENAHWLVSIPVEQDADWSLDFDLGAGHWLSMPSEIGIATVCDGAKYIHKREPYAGERAVILILSYDEKPEIAERRCKSAGIDPRPPLDGYLWAAQEIGVDFRTLPGIGRPKPPRVLALPRDAVPDDALCAAVAERVWAFTDAQQEVRECEAASALLRTQLETKPIIQSMVNATLASAQAKGLLYAAPVVHSRPAAPIEDWIVAFPLDELSAGWTLHTGDHAVECPFGSAILMEGYPMEFTLQPDGNPWANWAIMPYREYTQ